MTIRILLADDHDLMRQGLLRLLEDEKDLEVIGEAQNGREAIAKVEELSPDVAVLDVSMPDLNGVEAARNILQRTDKTRILALSMHTDRRFVMRMLEAGAMGYLPKNCAFDELATAIRAIHSGAMYLSPSLTRGVVEDLLRLRSEATRKPEKTILTGREREVLQLVAEGKTSKEIATSLGVSTNTVIRHRQNIMDKLELRTVAELTRYAIQEGIVSIN